MDSIEVKVFKGSELVFTKPMGVPVTAGEAKQALLDQDVTWRGDLTPAISDLGLVGKRELIGGETYHLHLQKQQGKLGSQLALSFIALAGLGLSHAHSACSPDEAQHASSHCIGNGQHRVALTGIGAS